MSSLIVSGSVSSDFCAITPSTFPDELRNFVDQFLSIEDLARSAAVCREWDARLEAKDLTALVAGQRIIDKDVWEKHLGGPGSLGTVGLSVDDVAFPSKKKLLPILKRMSRYPIEGNLGLTLLVLPKGLSLTKLRALFPDRFELIYSPVLVERGGDEIDRTRFILMTNGIFKGSRNKSVAEQRALAQEKGCIMPGFLSMLALLLLTEKSSEPPLRLLGRDPWTHTRCAETVNGCHMVVGGFAPSGLFVFTSDFATDSFGLVGAAEVL